MPGDVQLPPEGHLRMVRRALCTTGSRSKLQTSHMHLVPPFRPLMWACVHAHTMKRVLFRAIAGQYAEW